MDHLKPTTSVSQLMPGDPFLESSRRVSARALVLSRHLYGIVCRSVGYLARPDPWVPFSNRTRDPRSDPARLSHTAGET